MPKASSAFASAEDILGVLSNIDFSSFNLSDKGRNLWIFSKIDFFSAGSVAVSSLANKSLIRDSFLPRIRFIFVSLSFAALISANRLEFLILITLLNSSSFLSEASDKANLLFLNIAIASLATDFTNKEWDKLCNVIAYTEYLNKVDKIEVLTILVIWSLSGSTIASGVIVVTKPDWTDKVWTTSLTLAWPVMLEGPSLIEILSWGLTDGSPYTTKLPI